MHRHLIFAALAAAGLAVQARADQPVYSYVQAEFGAGSMKLDGQWHEASSLALRGATALGPRTYAFMDIATAEYPGDGRQLRFTPLSAGIGTHVSTGSADFFGSVALVTVRTTEQRFGNHSQNETGWNISLGLRKRGARFEYGFTSSRSEFDIDTGTVSSLTFGGRRFLSPDFALGLDLTARDYDRYTGHPREFIAVLTMRHEFDRPR